MMVKGGGDPLAIAREQFFDALTTGEGVRCPCCGRIGRVYKRKFNSGMARVLARLVALGGEREWVNVRRLFPGVLQRGGEWARARFWLFVEPRDHRTATANPRGDWRVTPWGSQFIREGLSVPKHVYIWDNTPISFSEDTTTFHEALGSHFDVAELLGTEERVEAGR